MKRDVLWWCAVILVLPLVNGVPLEPTDIAASPGETVQYQFYTRGPYPSLSYYVAASLSGTSPGIELPGGRIFPLNPDALFYLTLLGLYPSTIFSGLRGVIDGSGSGYFNITAPNEPALIGLQFHIAGATVYNGEVATISNPARLRVVAFNPRNRVTIYPLPGTSSDIIDVATHGTESVLALAQRGEPPQTPMFFIRPGPDKIFNTADDSRVSFFGEAYGGTTISVAANPQEEVAAYFTKLSGPTDYVVRIQWGGTNGLLEEPSPSSDDIIEDIPYLNSNPIGSFSGEIQILHSDGVSPAIIGWVEPDFATIRLMRAFIEPGTGVNRFRPATNVLYTIPSGSYPPTEVVPALQFTRSNGRCFLWVTTGDYNTGSRQHQTHIANIGCSGPPPTQLNWITIPSIDYGQYPSSLNPTGALDSKITSDGKWYAFGLYAPTSLYSTVDVYSTFPSGNIPGIRTEGVILLNRYAAYEFVWAIGITRVNNHFGTLLVTVNTKFGSQGSVKLMYKTTGEDNLWDTFDDGEVIGVIRTPYLLSDRSGLRREPWMNVWSIDDNGRPLIYIAWLMNRQLYVYSGNLL